MDKTIPFYIKVLSTEASNPHIYLYRGYTRTVLFESFEYSFDNVNWNTLIITDDPYIDILRPVTVGDIIYFRVKPTEGVWYKSSTDYCKIIPTRCTVEVGGNIMSLFYGSGFTGDETSFITGIDNCREIFASMDVVDASQLLLPASTLTYDCYHRMFYSCYLLTKAPIITQATIQGGYPYDYMFENCSSLESITIENTNIRINDYILYRMSPKTIVYKKEGVTTPTNPNNLTVVTLKNTPFNVANAKQWSINGKKVMKVVDSQNKVIWEYKINKTPFYVEDLSGNKNTVSIVKKGMYTSNAPTLTIEMSRDGISWSTLGTTSDVALTASIPANSKLYLRCSTSGWGNQYNSTAAYNAIDCSGSYGVGGNIMSLIYGDSFTGDEVDFKSLADYRLVFAKLFSGSINLIESSNLILRATTLVIAAAGSYTTVWGCYGEMFSGCTSLTNAPALPATTLANECYSDMFKGCTSLTAAPALPATILEEGCYASMFKGCTSLTAAPALPSETLAQSCYHSMFSGCTSLATAPALPATTLVPSCYMGMFNGCTSLTNAPILPATTLAGGCYHSMFSGCTSLTAAPTLQVETLVRSCYDGMFYGCTMMNNITCLATDISALDCLYHWVDGVSQTGTFTKKAGVSYPSGISGIPTGWTVIEV